ncbi:uncharacterized protein LOC120779920 [Bactrocera tryoni]|uniref:uncharacterized protein LOC120779920 n=1 Tax=Bactrocera tryoni TaxID=59916 RepID=UPI001A97101A|nr:uncharacterized protein LOC120779920 [Bactrocera tryoni]
MDKESEKLKSPVTQLLVRSRLDLEPEFAGGKRKKSVLWGKVLENMRFINLEVSQTKEFMQRKFLNLFATYKRIKKRNDATGRGVTTWEYFKDFDKVFGLRRKDAWKKARKKVSAEKNDQKLLLMKHWIFLKKKRGKSRFGTKKL